MIQKALTVTFLILLLTTLALAKVNINTASQDELETLQGIGTERAAAIIEYREQYGNFENPADLTNVSGIGPATFRNNQDRIVTD
ncbi:ComEA family DNA-binding protein [Desulfurispira natronophila]|uniref:Competence protein ComEA n=1 Tax=Desulfurispira natronophila TaxID=682562 RepID=A0A7W7Y526_9BACT|nr:ComEA family DNA-binding protein [Desulfurispira natronophila]MBB5022235.1 competence protein ComEA [Desulfurispira natronophila]